MFSKNEIYKQFISKTNRRKARGFVLAALIITPSIAYCERNIPSLPHEERFDENTYQDIVWVTSSGGATHEWISDGGWRGGAAKFHPPVTSDGRAGLGQFTRINNSAGTEQLNIRFLVYHGSEWGRVRTNNKVTIMNRTDGYARPMIGAMRKHENNYRTYAPCDNTVCKFEGGDYWPDGTDSLKLGQQPEFRSEEWISVELEANVRTGMMRLYVNTQDGDVSGLYVEKSLEESPVGPGTPLLHYIDIIGGWFNAGTPYHRDTYYKIDELVISDTYIGPPDGFVGGVDPDPIALGENSFVSLNPSMVSTAVISLADDNIITAGDVELDLGLYEHGDFQSADGPVITPGTVISGTGPFDLGSVISGTDIPVHASMLGRRFAMPHYRYDHHYHMVSPRGDASVTVSVDGTVHRLALEEGEVVDFGAGEVNGNLGSVIASDTPILVSHSASSPHGRADASPMPPSATELWGICSHNAYVTAVEDSTEITVYTSNSDTPRTMTVNAGQRHQVCSSLPFNSVRQGLGPAVRIVSDKPVSAVQVADGDGVEQTAFYPTRYLKSRFGIPKDSQYIAVTCPSADTTVTLYRDNAAPAVKDCSASGNRPGKVYFGSAQNGTHIAHGSYLESNRPVYVIYEVARSNDEHNLMGADAYAAAIFSADMEGQTPADQWVDRRTEESGNGGSINFPVVGGSRVARFNYQQGRSNVVWLRHNFGDYINVREDPVGEVWLNLEYEVSNSSVYNQNPGQASKILYFNWSSPSNRTRTFQVVLSAVDNGHGHRFRLSKEVFNDNGSWKPGGEWLTGYAAEAIPENEKMSLQLHIRNSTNGEPNGLVQLYNNGELILERRDVALNDDRGHFPNMLVLTPQISHTPPGAGANGYAQYDNVALFNTDPGQFGVQ
jgi:hypothetical protein